MKMQVVKEICGKVAVMERGEMVEDEDVFSIFASFSLKIASDFKD